MIKKRLEGPLGGILFYLIASLFIIFWVSRSWNDENKPYIVLFHHITYNFSFEYPSYWTVIESDEGGYRGQKDVRATVYESIFGTNFLIVVEQTYHSHPSLADVILWDDERIKTINQYWVKKNSPTLSPIESQNEIIDNTKVVRRTYSRENYSYQSIYLARKNDMIIITLECDTLNCDLYLPDFEKLVASFTPKY